MSYCHFCSLPTTDKVHQDYHNFEYGFPIHDDDRLFERLVLEINQAGLSWTTILKKKSNFYSAYNQFKIATVANYKQKDINRLLNDAGIIRNRLKVQAAIYNANQILSIQQEYGSFKQWLINHHPLTKEEWVKIFKKKFKFVGGEIVNEFLMSSGFLKGAHQEECKIHKKIIKQNPPWAIKKK